MHKSIAAFAVVLAAWSFAPAGMAADEEGEGGTRAAPAARTQTPASVPGAATQPALKPGEAYFNFQGADLQAVVKAVSDMTGRNFLVDPRMKGQVTIISARPLSAAAAYQVFLSALKAQGFTAVEGPGNVVRIIPTAEAKLNADISTRAVPRGEEQIVTHVATVEHVSASQLVPVLRPLMAPTSQLSAYEPANVLVITDYADNVRRLLAIIEKVDLPASAEVNVVRLQHASALDLADVITRLATTGSTRAPVPGTPVAQAGGGDQFTIAADMRTNSLLVRAESAGRFAQIRALIEKLDVPATTTGNTRVVYLKNAEAAKLVEVLRGLLTAEARAAPGGTATPAAVGAAARTAARTVEPSLIQADPATNSLIISAPDSVYNNLRNVIEQLDVRRAQVFVEALIVEITADKSDELGFQWAGARASGSGAIGVATNFPSANPSILGAAASPETALPSAAGLAVAYLGRTITLPDGTQVRSLGALARALESNSLGNVLSTPTLMTLDNAEAKIVVGQNVPFVTGSFAQATSTAGAAVNPFQTIERKDVGLTLKIKPQISDGGTIRLEIYQEVSSVVPTVTAGASDLITNKRSLDTKVAIDSGNTIVLGGLIEDTAQETMQQVPLLGSIPVIGALFRYREQVVRRTNLMVFLRPTIVRTAEDGYRVTVDRYEYLRAKTQEFDEERAGRIERLAPVPVAPRPKAAPSEGAQVAPAAESPKPAGEAPAVPAASEERPPGAQ
jgi:general secretion pathway protein D